VKQWLKDMKPFFDQSASGKIALAAVRDAGNLKDYALRGRALSNTLRAQLQQAILRARSRGYQGAYRTVEKILIGQGPDTPDINADFLARQPLVQQAFIGPTKTRVEYHPGDAGYQPLLAAVLAAQDVEAKVRARLAKERVVAARSPEEEVEAIDARIAAGAAVYPPTPLRALELTPFHDVRVVLLGQDPYHGAVQAHGGVTSAVVGRRLAGHPVNVLRGHRGAVERRQFSAASGSGGARRAR
jgi:hypothetical protein